MVVNVLYTQRCLFLFICLLMLTCRSPARLTFYGVHIFLDIILSEPGSIDILCCCSYFSWCRLVRAGSFDILWCSYFS